MTKFSVTKEIQFCYGHRVPFHESKCKNVHGHQAKVECTVEGPLVPDASQRSDSGMVVDFGEIKRAMYEEIEMLFDHRFIKWYNDVEMNDLLNCKIAEVQPERRLKRFETDASMCLWTYNVKGFGWIQEIPYVPTAENLAYLCYQLLKARIDKDETRVKSIRFWETPTSVAEYSPDLKRAASEPYIPCSSDLEPPDPGKVPPSPVEFGKAGVSLPETGIKTEAPSQNLCPHGVLKKQKNTMSYAGAIHFCKCCENVFGSLNEKEDLCSFCRQAICPKCHHVPLTAGACECECHPAEYRAIMGLGEPKAVVELCGAPSPVYYASELKDQKACKLAKGHSGPHKSGICQWHSAFEPELPNQCLSGWAGWRCQLTRDHAGEHQAGPVSWS